MNRFNRTAKIVSVATLSFLLTSACGAKKDEGEGLAVATQPSNEVLLGPGPEQSCLDKENTKLTGTTITRSVSGPVMKFNNFQLQWTSPDTLFLQEIRWTIEGVGISGGTFTASLSADEVEALVALEGATQVGPSAVINSSDPNRNSLPKFAPCGLALGGVTLADPQHQTPFKARVTIEVIGTAQDTDGNQRFVRQRIQTTARFEGI